LWEKEETGLQRREKGSQWLSVVGWWLPVVELVVAGTRGGEGERKLQKRGREASFWSTLDPIFSSLRP
jgi:hypothetical protein